MWAHCSQGALKKFPELQIGKHFWWKEYCCKFSQFDTVSTILSSLLSRQNSKALLLLQHHNISTYWVFFFPLAKLGPGRNGGPEDYDFWSFDIWKGDAMWAHCSQLCFEQTSSPIFPPFNTTTLIKPMNEEEEEAPLEDPRICRNRLGRERHATRFEKQCVADANRRATHRADVNCCGCQPTGSLENCA
jgi:hypothetical protein